MSDLNAKMHQSPQTKGPTSKGREGERRGEEERGGEVRGVEGLAATTWIWNSSPDDIVWAQTLLPFHRLLKTYIVSHFQKLHS